MKEIFRDVDVRMKQAVDHLQHELKRLRTGRASLALLDGITVDYYGSPVPLTQVANLSAADATMLVAQPYDPSQSSAIERAIRMSDLGLNPSVDGKVIRIPLPALTEERRQEIVKKAQELAEHARKSIRQSRQDGIDRLKTMERDRTISQDDARRGLDEVQKLHDRYLEEINSALRKKEQQVLE